MNVFTATCHFLISHPSEFMVAKWKVSFLPICFLCLLIYMPMFWDKSVCITTIPTIKVNSHLHPFRETCHSSKTKRKSFLFHQNTNVLFLYLQRKMKIIVFMRFSMYHIWMSIWSVFVNYFRTSMIFNFLIHTVPFMINPLVRDS